MTASIELHRPDAGASTAQSPAKGPGEGDDGGVARHVTIGMHALFRSEVQSILRGKTATLVLVVEL